MAWRAVESPAEIGAARRYTVEPDGEAPMSWRQVLAGWADAGDFSEWWSSTLAAHDAAVYRWETPCLVDPTSLDERFEFVVVDDPWLDRPADRRAFEDHFDAADPVVAFDNLGCDARMIVPCPVTEGVEHTHLASFLRSAPEEQRSLLWAMVAAEVRATLEERPLWLSTAGGGVAWLHVRLDSSPKYYAYTRYREMR